MRLVPRRVPIKVVANAQSPVGMVREVGDLVQRLVQEGNAAQPAERSREAFERAGRQARCASAECGVEPFLRPGVAAIEPDGQSAAGSNPRGELMKRQAGVRAVMQDADREDQVKLSLRQR